jgi:hypothetical protein
VTYTPPSNAVFVGYLWEAGGGKFLTCWLNWRPLPETPSGRHTAVICRPEPFDRFSELFPAWEESAQQFLARTPEHRKRIVAWARSDDHQAALEPSGGRVNTFCRIHDDAGRASAVSRPWPRSPYPRLMRV